MKTKPIVRALRLPDPRRRLVRLWPLLAGLLLCSLILGQLAWGEERELPPPPAMPPEVVDEVTPTVDVAVLRPAEGALPHEIWSDADSAPVPVRLVPAPAGAMQPAEPALSAPAGDESVKAMLDAVGMDAPRNNTLESVLFTQLQAVMPQGSEGYLFDRATLPDVKNLPPTGWKVQYNFKLPERGIGTIPFTANLTGNDGKLLRRFSGSVNIDREARGMQVTRVIPRGEALSVADVKVFGTRLSLLPRGAFDGSQTVAGMVSRQELRPGQWLTEQMVEVPEVVKRNQGVTVRLARGPIQITAPGITRQDGALGEVIRVQNAQSKREVFARVISKDEVQVVF